MLLAQAAQWLRAGRPAEAIPLLREAARRDPGNADILHDLGLACLECGLIGEAIDGLRRAIAARPAFADAHLRLGIALEVAGALEAALAAYRRAYEIRPSLADARYRAGELLESLGQTAPAIQAFRRAAAAAPRTTLGRIATAKALLAEDRDAEAEKTLRQALALDRTNAVAMELLGQVLAERGQFGQAREWLLLAIAQAPQRAGSYYDVVRCGRIGTGDAALLAAMREAAERPGLEPAQRSRVHLALGKAEQDLGNHAAAMRHFDAAEALRNLVLRFDPADFEARVARLIACFTAGAMARAATPARPDVAPILVLGLPRSGTTLVEQILSAHPQVRPGGELPFWNALGREWDRAGAEIPDAGFLAQAAADYLLQLRHIARGASVVTDKMPMNVLWAGLIHMALPHAKIIHCRRCPVDTALSIHQTHFNPRMGFPTGGAALVRTIRATQRVTSHWQAVLPPGTFIGVDYEALVSSPGSEIPRILAACGLPWDPACLHPENNARVLKTASKFQAREPIHGGSVGRWRDYEPWLGPLGALLQAAPAASHPAVSDKRLTVN
jgi:tetratricopeptide (TPR) repeat protein